ncbi:MAG: DegT/DnrJ/EryC1/StrS family aminotransferase [Bryobacterales bacterium]|nr:DegT/DnrJ/EryC1/StrS family aminotransferase [Bryobacterales bacterium]
MTAARSIPLLDLRAQHKQIRDEIVAEVTRLIDSQRFILGEEVAELERQVAGYCNAAYGIGCASGTDALVLALTALDIGRGDQVLTVPYTFFATAGAIADVGAEPVFVDIDEDTCQMDVEQVEAALNRYPRVKAIVPVHLFGSCVDMDPLLAVAADRGIPIVEDAAQAIGAEYRGRRAGGMGAIGCFSFFPSKNLGGYGDGGMLTTTDARLAERLRALRVHGSRRKYYHEEVGFNSRLDTLQAAVLLVKFRYLDVWTAARQRNAERYRRVLGHSPAPVRFQAVPPFVTRHVVNQFIIRAPGRDALKAFLADRGIGTEVYYPLPLHRQPCFSTLGYREGDFPASERLAAESLALPVYPELAEEDLEAVCAAIRGYYAG